MTQNFHVVISERFKYYQVSFSLCASKCFLLKTFLHTGVVLTLFSSKYRALGSVWYSIWNTSWTALFQYGPTVHPAHSSSFLGASTASFICSVTFAKLLHIYSLHEHYMTKQGHVQTTLAFNCFEMLYIAINEKIIRRRPSNFAPFLNVSLVVFSLLWITYDTFKSFLEQLFIVPICTHGMYNFRSTSSLQQALQVTAETDTTTKLRQYDHK